jgi:hypothetical protein
MFNKRIPGVALAGMLVASVAFSQTTLGTIRLTHAVLADGKPLAAATYQVRLTNEEPKPAVGQSPSGEQWVEFVKNGTVAGRELATVISASDIGAVAKGPAPKAEGSRVDVLKEGEYVRVWMNRRGTNYIINMPVAR